jgi:ribosomal protein S3
MAGFLDQRCAQDIDYGVVHAATTYGRIGVKVWVYKVKCCRNAPSRPRLP